MEVRETPMRTAGCEETHVVLRDGSLAHVRPVRADDEFRLFAFLRGLRLQSMSITSRRGPSSPDASTTTCGVLAASLTPPRSPGMLACAAGRVAEANSDRLRKERLRHEGHTTTRCGPT